MSEVNLHVQCQKCLLHEGNRALAPCGHRLCEICLNTLITEAGRIRIILACNVCHVHVTSVQPVRL